MKQDSVAKVLNQWDKNGPDLQIDGLGVAVRIDRLAVALTDRANLALEPLKLTMWEYDVLSTLRRQNKGNALSAGDLASETGMSSGAITHRVDRLVARGLVQRFRDEADRRSVFVRLTRQGKTAVEEALAKRVGIADQALSALSTRERGQLDRLLRKLLMGLERDAE